MRRAMQVRDLFLSRGYEMYLDSPTNQQFIVMEDDKLKAFAENVRYGFWEKTDENHTVIRLATDWATTDEDIEKLMSLL